MPHVAAQRVETDVLLHKSVLHLVGRFHSKVAQSPRVTHVGVGAPHGGVEGRQRGPGLRGRRAQRVQHGGDGVGARRRLERAAAPHQRLDARRGRAAQLVEPVHSPGGGHVGRRDVVGHYLGDLRHRPAVHVLSPPAHDLSVGLPAVGARQVAVLPHHGAVPAGHPGALLVTVGDVLYARPRRVGAVVMPVLSRHGTELALAGGFVRIGPHVALYSQTWVGAGVGGGMGREGRVVFGHGAIVAGVPGSRFLEFRFDYLTRVGARLGRVWTRL